MAKNRPSQGKPVRRKRTFRYILGGFIILLIAFRLYLPTIVLHFVNRKLAEIHGYKGHVDDVDLHLIAGSYSIKGIRLDKTGGNIPIPFFSASRINFSLQWKALFHGAFVGKIIAYDPSLNYVKGPTEATTQTSIDKDWTQVVDELMPLRINRFEILHGDVHFRDYHSDPKVNIYLNNVHILAENLTNVRNKNELLPARVSASAGSYGGTAELFMRIDPLNANPTFDMNVEMKDFDLTGFNNYLKAYARFDVQKGTISFYSEAAARDGQITGYVKPIIKDVKVVDWKKEQDPFLQKLWESAVGATAFIFKNHQKDQLASKIDFSGSVNDPSTDIWSIVGETLRNAFVKALIPALDNSVNISQVR